MASFGTGAMDPEVTPRAKSAQVAPDAPAQVLIHRTPRGSKAGDAAPAAPAIGTTTADEVEQLVRYGGRAAAKRSLRLCLTLLIPMAVVAVWMFAMFSVISWALPNHLCYEAAIELSGSTVGFSKCVYNSGVKYTPYSSSKVFWLIFWAVQNAWICVFPGFICKAIFGSCMSRLQIGVTALLGAGCFVAPFITALVFNMALNNYVVLASSTLGSLVVNLVCSSAAVRYCANPLMRWRWFFLFVVAGQVNTFYLFVMPYVITARSQLALSGMALTVVQLFVHPFIWAVVLFFFRLVMRHIGRVKDFTQTCFLVWPVLYASLYGRFLLLQLSNVGSVVIMNFMGACLNIVGDLTGRGDDNLWLALLYGDRAGDAIVAVRAIDEFALVENLIGTMMEVSSILSCAALISFGKIASTPGQPPDNRFTWYNAVAQLITTTLFSFADFIASGKFNNLEWEKVYPRNPTRFLCYVLVVLTIGGSRLCLELLQLFCPKHYDGYGILLEECDRPSVFQAISYSFANRAHGTVLGNLLNIRAANGTVNS